MSARAALQLVAAIVGPAPQPRIVNGLFAGFQTSQPGTHVPGRESAWCWPADSWCLPTAPCSACEPPIDRRQLRQALTRAGGAMEKP